MFTKKICNIQIQPFNKIYSPSMVKRKQIIFNTWNKKDSFNVYFKLNIESKANCNSKFEKINLTLCKNCKFHIVKFLKSKHVASQNKQ